MRNRKPVFHRRILCIYRLITSYRNCEQRASVTKGSRELMQSARNTPCISRKVSVYDVGLDVQEKNSRRREQQVILTHAYARVSRERARTRVHVHRLRHRNTCRHIYACCYLVAAPRRVEGWTRVGGTEEESFESAREIWGNLRGLDRTPHRWYQKDTWMMMHASLVDDAIGYPWCPRFIWITISVS